DGGGCIVAGEDKESLIIVRPTVESTSATHARQLDDAVGCAVNRIALNLCLCVVHIRDNEATANKRTKFKHSVLSLRDEFNEHRFRIGEVYCHKPASLCALLRKQEKLCTDVAGKEPGMVESIDYSSYRPVGIDQVDHSESVAARESTRGDYGVSSVCGDIHRMNHR